MQSSVFNITVNNPFQSDTTDSAMSLDDSSKIYINKIVGPLHTKQLIDEQTLTNIGSALTADTNNITALTTQLTTLSATTTSLCASRSTDEAAAAIVSTAVASHATSITSLYTTVNTANKSITALTSAVTALQNAPASTVTIQDSTLNSFWYMVWGGLYAQPTSPNLMSNIRVYRMGSLVTLTFSAARKNGNGSDAFYAAMLPSYAIPSANVLTSLVVYTNNNGNYLCTLHIRSSDGLLQLSPCATSFNGVCGFDADTSVTYMV